MFLLRFLAASLVMKAAACLAAITISNVADKTKYDAPRSFTVAADPNAVTTTATLNGVPVPVGVAVNVTDIGFQELRAESRDAGGALVDTRTVRFITRDASRAGSEDGIPPFTPYKSVPDAASAFIGATLKVIAPAAWPVGFPVPLAVKLVDGANESLLLNGVVAFGGFPGTSTPLRRGWGSVNAPAQPAAGTVNVNAMVNSLANNPQILIENTAFIDVAGTISSDTTWPANSRMRVTNRLTINAGVTLTIEQGCIVLMDTGTVVNGSAAEISTSGTLLINGTELNPVVFAPATPGAHWGGIELPVATSLVEAHWTIFTGAGEDENWFGNNPSIGGSRHQDEQPLFAVAGSGSGTSVGARLRLHDCFSFEHAGQQMNSRTNTEVTLNRTLFQKCITSGQLNGSKVAIDRSALIEFPDETGNFVNDDNDALYLTSGDLSISNTVIGFTKDDGVDSGGDGGSSPFGTVNPHTGTTATRFDSTNNWYEGTTHEGNSLSGTRNVYFTGCVFLNCGQGIEAGYSSGSSAEGPSAYVDGCLFVNNVVAMRVGDNYGSGYSYNSTADVRNSLILNSSYHDVWSYNWHPTNANAWIYLDGTTTNSLGRPWFKVEDNLLSKPDPLHHPMNTQWNPANPAHVAQLANFMPVPGSNVGVAVSTYAAPQEPTAAYAGAFTVRLSTFSSREVSVGWAVIGKADPFGDAATTLASGTLVFLPGQALQTINAPVATPGNYGLIHVALTNPVNAEVTGEKIYITPDIVASLAVAGYGSGGTGAAGSGAGGSVWRAKTDFTNATLATFITNFGATWKSAGFDDSSWATLTTHTGYGDGDENQAFARTDYDPGASGTQSGPVALFRRTFTIENVANVTALTGEITYDDGAVVHVNGVEVLRTDNLAPGAALSDYAIFNSAAARENALAALNIPPGLLVDGENIIAVEVHQRDSGSSDLSFDLRLTATFDVPLVLNFAPANGRPVLWWPGLSDFLEHSTDLIEWRPLPLPSPLAVPGGREREFFRLRR